MIDLHSHTTASDGSYTPSELVKLAVSMDLNALALTDHDTTSGLDEFVEAAAGTGLQAVPGVEVAAACGKTSVHLVGLFVNREGTELQQLLHKIRQSRSRRNQAIVAKLQARGIEVSYEDICASAGDPGVVGRPHIARALIDSGVCRDSREAFNQYLGAGRAAYVKRFSPSSNHAIDCIHAAGGVTVLAHPLGYRSTPEAKLRQLMKRLKKQGLDAVEVMYSEYSEQQQATVLKLCDELDLLKSGGTDFHGSMIPRIKLGTGYGNMSVPDEFLAPLAERSRLIRTGS